MRVGSVAIGGGSPVVVQSMCATKTADVEATVAQIDQLAATGAGIVRVAVDSQRDCEALREIRQRTEANLSVDLQENYRLAAAVAPWVDKIRYNPGHLYHHERTRAWQDKVRFLVDVAGQHDCALRVGVNCGSVDPAKTSISPRLLAGEGRRVRADRLAIDPDALTLALSQKERGPSDSPRPLAGEGQGPLEAMLESALEHCELLDRLGFVRYCVSLKDSQPANVVEVNRRFAASRPDVPLHLGVTEAGLPPEGILKTRAALAPLLRGGIGDTIRVSLTVPVGRKHEEVEAGLQILADLAAGRLSEPGPLPAGGLNIISCPSCSRVENEAFVELAQRVQEALRYAAAYPITVAVMGCRVNGPGETDHADLGLWCGRDAVHLKRGAVALGTFSYEEVVARLKAEVDALIRD
jgi:(E)-4-hydroxy-3-methylbut-2-enyl-diphosphate synthase